MHKNSYLKNNSLYINNFKEIVGKNSEYEPEKIIFIVEGCDVLDYKNFLCMIDFNAQLKFNKDLKINMMNVQIKSVELKDSKNSINLLEVGKKFINMYYSFKSFMFELKRLIQDLNFLNDF